MGVAPPPCCPTRTRRPGGSYRVRLGLSRTSRSSSRLRTGIVYAASLRGVCRDKQSEREEKGPAARRRPKAGREAYFLYVERSAEGGNEADGPLSSREADVERRALVCRTVAQVAVAIVAQDVDRAVPRVGGRPLTGHEHGAGQGLVTHLQREADRAPIVHQIDGIAFPKTTRVCVVRMKHANRRARALAEHSVSRERRVALEIARRRQELERPAARATARRVGLG